MTNEEAIKELKESHDIMRSYDVDESESRLMIALDMAIKALEQQSMPTMVYPQVEGITPVVVEPIPKLPPVNQQEPSGDLISRQDAIKAIDEKAKRIKNEDTLNGLAGAVGILFDLPPVKPQKPKTEQFAKWVASEIFDEMWEYNKDAFAEIACRKLEKLGIVRAKGDEWELIESKESDHKCHTCKHYTSGEHDGSCGSYICKGYSDWESEE